MDIYPSILSKSAIGITGYIGGNLKNFSHFQIDIVDGVFVKGETVSLKELAEHLQKNPPRVPPNNTFEFHLMVEDFEVVMPHIDEISTHLPVAKILIHLQPALRWTKGDHEPLHEILHDRFPFAFGLAINPEVEVLSHYETLKGFETIQIMTVKPGKQGQKLHANSLKKIGQLRRHGYEGRIVLDGAMNAKTLTKVVKQKHWPDAVCPGSYLKTSTKERLEKLQKIVIKAQDKRFASS